MTLATMKATTPAATPPAEANTRNEKKAAPLRGYNVRMEGESLHVLKRAALDNGTTMRAIFIAGVNDWLARHGVSHTVE